MVKRHNRLGETGSYRRGRHLTRTHSQIGCWPALLDTMGFLDVSTSRSQLDAGSSTQAAIRGLKQLIAAVTCTDSDSDTRLAQVKRIGTEVLVSAAPMIGYLERTNMPYAEMTKRRLFSVAEGQIENGGEWIVVASMLVADLERLNADLDVLSVPLTERDRAILTAMLELGCTSMKPESAETIIKTALHKGDVKRAFKSLLANGLVESKPGRSGGYWLTQKGLALAKSMTS